LTRKWRFPPETPFSFSSSTLARLDISAKREFTEIVRTCPFFLSNRIPSGKTRRCKLCLVSKPAETQAELRFSAGEIVF